MEIPPVAVVVTTVILVGLGALSSHYVHTLKRHVRQLKQRIETLELEQAVRPATRVAFEFRAATREALLHVSNDGGDAEMWAPLSIEGALANQPEGELRAAWLGGEGSTALIRKGETRTLRMAQLDLSVFPYAQWQVYGITGTGMVLSIGAAHTSMIGGDPATHAPTVFLQVALVSVPAASGPPPHSTIALQPFDAVRLRSI